jgi:surface-anchored protein
MSTHDGIDATDVATVVPGTHFDPNWAFSQPGRYQISFHISGTLAAGAPTSADATYTFVVKSFASAQGTQLARNEVIEVDGSFALVNRVTPISVAPHGGGVSTVGIKGIGTPAVTTANDTILAHVANYETTVLAREGQEVPGIAGSKIRTFNDAFFTVSGECALSAMLLQGAGGVTKLDDTILLARVYDAGSDAYVLATVVREGGAVPGHPGFGWTKFFSYLPAEDGTVVVIGAAKNASTGVNKTIALRATRNGLGFDLAVLAATGGTIVTDSGVHTVKSIGRPTRPGTRAADQLGGFELLIGLDDGTSEIVRFAGAVSPI